MDFDDFDDDDISSLGEDPTIAGKDKGAKNDDDNKERPTGLEEEEEENDQEDEADLDDPDAFRKCIAEEEFNVSGLKMHEAFDGLLSPMEFEEIVALFKEADVNNNGFIDKFEARKILFNLKLDATLVCAENFLALVSLAGAPDVNFDEFCQFVVNLKNKDNRLREYVGVLDTIYNSVLGRLEQLSRIRNLAIKFFRIDRTDMTFKPGMPLMTMEVQISGEWYHVEDGKRVGRYEVRKFVGTGDSPREAKISAANAALAFYEHVMPGLKYPPGEVPHDWMTWIDDNLARGVEPEDIISILAGKGFNPQKNILLMQRVLTWTSFTGFLKRYKRAYNTDFDVCDASLDFQFQEWCKDLCNKGVDGVVLNGVLEDRGFLLSVEHVHFYQKLITNQLGCLIDRDGRDAHLLDFWRACEMGYLDEVRIYCACLMPVNEEQVGRHTSNALRPLTLAAIGNHWKVIRMLLEHGADVRAVDRRGRSALHYAAYYGNREACEVLVDAKSYMFSGDFQGNNALHHAALGNRPNCIDFLAKKGQDLCADIVSDKVFCRPGVTFVQLTTEAFSKIQEMKLSPYEARRVEKKWLLEVANLFISLMSDETRHMLAPPCAEVVEDVLRRFDPRPESGMDVATGPLLIPTFTPTIGTVQELGTLLLYLFRQTACDSVNGLQRTALHILCDNNQLNSHAESIRILTEVYGCNVSIKDKLGYSGLQLLCQDKKFANNPTATRIREEYLVGIRERNLDIISDRFDEEDRIEHVAHRTSVMNECIRFSEKPSTACWDIIREASGRVRTFACNKWEVYADPDTLSLLYCTVPEPHPEFENEMIPYGNYSWSIPKELKPIADRLIALDFQRKFKSTFKRKLGIWEMYVCNSTNLTFYYDSTRELLRFSLPESAKWETLLKTSEVIERIGYGNEWQIMKEKNSGNLFYKHLFNGECFWDPPSDAVRIKKNEMLCTAFQFRSRAVEQVWYTCEQCNRNSMLAGRTGEKKLKIRICEGCIARCHKGHKGIRVLDLAPARRADVCSCETLCRVCNSRCVGWQLSERQQMVQRQSFDERIELKRKAEQDELMPPVFTMVPARYPDGTEKKLSGWMLVRQVPINNKPLHRFGEVLASDLEAHDDTDDEDDYHPDDKPEENPAIEDASTANNNQDESGKGNTSGLELAEGVSDVMSFVSSEDSLKQNDKGDNTSIVSLEGEDDREAHYLEGLPPGWIACVDAEEPDLVPIGARVLCTGSSSPPKIYGYVTKMEARGRWGIYYSVRYDNVRQEEWLSRDCIEIIDRNIFYSNPATGECAWSIEEANESPQQSGSLHIPGNDWLEMHLVSSFRRTFTEEIEEYFSPIVNFPFYVNTFELLREQSAIRIQAFFRRYWKRPLYCLSWHSTAFFFDPTEELIRLQRELSGWAYLRRRSECIGDFNDVDRLHWEEYMDKKSLELFYWQEDNNVYRWDKPKYNDASTFKAMEYFKINQELLYITPSKEEINCIVIRIRFDDETGEDLYDVCKKSDPTIVYKWIRKIQLKTPPMESEEYMLLRAEVRWKKALRRQREADARKAKKDYEAKLAKAMQRFNLGLPVEGDINDAAKVHRAKTLRITQEIRDVEDEHEYTVGAKRRQQVVATLEELRKDASLHLSRADYIRISRQLDLKLRMDEKLSLSHAIRSELQRQKQMYKDRVLYIEDYLREKEEPVTTPRSQIRRGVIRHLNMCMSRQDRCYMICQWGCGDWIKVGQKQIDHQSNLCPKRILGCTLGCTVKLAEEVWHAMAMDVCTEIKKKQEQAIGKPGSKHGSKPATPHNNTAVTVPSTQDLMKTHPSLANMNMVLDDMTYQQYHEEEECVKRLIDCPQHCLEFVIYDKLEEHLREFCTKRPAKPLVCRIGCGTTFGGLVESLIEAEDDRLLHELEQCEFRMVRCNWKFEDDTICAAQMPFREREKHRDYHLEKMGKKTYSVAGTYTYRIPRNMKRIKVQVWGAGGGSGYFWDRRGGSGGGGAFVECIMNVEPYEVLEIVVGAGGGKGVQGTEVEVADADKFRQKSSVTGVIGRKVTAHEKAAAAAIDVTVIDGTCGVALGGQPGGGEGYGGGGCWACGGGGGYSMVSLRTSFGNTALIVAGGGGGGGSVDGMPGVGMEGPLAGTKIDIINGESASAEGPGREGDCGTVYNSKWPATPGEAWRGGNGSEFGAGGGSGYFGGGGGGTVPGVGGGGGGGSSYIYIPRMHDHLVIHGHGHLPGGLDHDPPQAVGLGDWDVTGGFCGQGGKGHKNESTAGNTGAVRIIKPGHY